MASLALAELAEVEQSNMARETNVKVPSNFAADMLVKSTVPFGESRESILEQISLCHPHVKIDTR